MLKKFLTGFLALSVSIISLSACSTGSNSTGSSSSSAGGSSAVSSQAAASSQTAKKSGFKIGFANGYIGNSWRTQFIQSIDSVAKEYKQQGILSDYQIANSNADVTQQLNQINGMINSGVDAIIIDPVSATSLGSVVANAKAKGIMVVISNDIAAYDGNYAVVNDIDAMWRIQAKWFAEKLNGKGNIVEVTGLPGNTSDKQRIDAAADVFKNYPNIKVLAAAPGKWSESTAQSVMSTFLSTYNNIDGVLMEDVMSNGALRAYENAGKTPPILSGDCIMSYITYWNEHPELQSIAVPSVPAIGANTLRVTVRLLQGKALKADSISANPLKADLKNTVILPPPFVITNDGAKGKWMDGYDKTQSISVKRAAEMGQGKAAEYQLDEMMDDATIDSFFN